jgi:hypothetical protein
MQLNIQQSIQNVRLDVRMISGYTMGASQEVANPPLFSTIVLLMISSHLYR